MSLTAIKPARSIGKRIASRKFSISVCQSSERELRLSFRLAARTELRDAMDGGTRLDTDTWHPLRGFMLHKPAAVQERARLSDSRSPGGISNRPV